MASEPVECQVLVLRVSIHCEGCKKKVKKVLLHVDGVYRCDVDGRSNKVMVTASRRLDAGVLVARLRKSGKLAEPWPEALQPEEPAAENQADDPGKPNEPAPDNAAAEPSNGQPTPEPEKSADEAPKPDQEAAADETKAATEQQPDEGKEEKASQQQLHDHQEKRPIDATVTVEFDRGGGGGGGGYPRYHMRPMPAHVMSYNVARPMASASYYYAAAPTPAAAPMPAPMARPMASASYYAAAPTPAPAPAAAPMPAAMARPGPSQRYIDEYAPPPSYYSRAAPPSYEPYSYGPPQPSPYHHHSQRSPADDDDYYYAAPPQRSAFSPPRDMFNDENANSCIVM